MGELTPVTPNEEAKKSFGVALYRLWTRVVLIDDTADDFPTKLRKSAAGIVVATSPAAASLGSYLAYLGWGDDSSQENKLGIRIGAINFFAVIFTLFAPLVMLRWQRTLSVRTMDVQIFAIFVHLVIIGQTMPQIGMQSLFVSLTLFALLAQTQFRAVQFGLSIVMFAVSSYNQGFMDDKDAMKLLIPGFRHGPPLEVFLGQLCISFCSVVLLTGVFMQSSEHVRSIERAHAAVLMSQHIVDLLRRYDTEGVKTVLAGDEARSVDPQLVASLTAMNANLESYKPFLPNYLFQQADSGDGPSNALDTDDEGDLSRSGSVDGGHDTLSARDAAGKIKRRSRYASNAAGRTRQKKRKSQRCGQR